MVDVARLLVRMEAENSKLTKDLNKSKRDVRRFESQVKKSAKSVKTSFSGVFAGLVGALSTRQILGVVTDFEKLNASLVTVTGSTEAAEEAMRGIQGFAATVPFAIQEVTDSFIKLKAFGLDPSMDALTSYANTASAMGKSLNQVIEAVADAATGEFERLKEFGIKAKSQGDQVIFTFRGVSTTVSKTASDIEGYIRDIGANDFAGAASLQIDTLGGAFVNLSDSIAIATNELAKSSGFVDYLKRTSIAISEIISFSLRSEDPLSKVGKRLNELVEQRNELRASLKSTGDDDVWAGLYRQLQGVNKEIKANKDEFDALIKARNAAGAGTPDSGDTTPVSDAAGADKLKQSAIEVRDEWDIAFDLIDAQFKEVDKQWAQGFTGLEKVSEQLDGVAEKTEETADKMSVFAEQAARNMQDDFAEYLFDPFKEDGLKGMLDGFVTTLRKMASQAAAAKIFESLGSAAGSSSNAFIASLGSFLTPRATGGPLAAGQASLIGEEGPELFVPAVAGTVIPNDKLGAAAPITVHVTAPAGRDSRSASQFGFEVATALSLAQRRNG